MSSSGAFEDLAAAFDPSTFSKEFSPSLRKYLARVYGSLFATVSLAVVGCVLVYANLVNSFVSSACAIGGLILITYLAISRSCARSSSRDPSSSLFILLLAGLMMGVGTGPYLMSLRDQTIPVTAFALTCVTFASCSAISLVSTRPKFFFLGSMVLSAIAFISIAQTMYLFMSLAVTLPFWSASVLSLLFVVASLCVNTMRVVQRYEAGERDHVGSALDLFVDFIGLFMRIVKLLASLQDQQKKEEQRRRRERR